MSTAELTDAERGYLETLYWLHEAGLPMTAANVARAMQLSAPAVHEMIGRLERDGHVSRSSDKVISFTESGERQAEEIVGRHRLIERFLTDVLGIPWDEVHEEAERLEHAMSPVLEERMFAAIGEATTCPHGHPIRVGTRVPGRPARRRQRGREHPRAALRERGGGPAPLPARHGSRAGARGHRDRVRRAGDRRPGGRPPRVDHAERCGDRLGHRRPLAAAARCAARAARARHAALRPLAASVDLEVQDPLGA